MSDKLKIFRDEFLNANTWEQWKDGIPLGLLDELSEEELITAEKEMIEVISSKDDWPIKGLGHIKSQKALPALYDLLSYTKKGMKVITAHSIFQINEDNKMVEIALIETPKISSQYELIDILYFLKGFKDERVNKMLNGFREHKKYLVAYNATQAMGLSTKDIVEKFRNKESNSIWNRFKLW